jgi:hypothetical protein
MIIFAGMKRIGRNGAIGVLAAALLCAACGQRYGIAVPMENWTKSDGGKVRGTEISVCQGDTLLLGGEYRNFCLTGEAYAKNGAEAALMFHSDGKSGYEVLLHNGPIDGSRKTGSLSAVRNLYRSLAEDGEWFDFELAVRGKNIAVKVKGTDVVCYTEPDAPYRTEEYATRLLGRGGFALIGRSGEVKLRDLRVTRLRDDAVNPADTLPPIDEQTDEIIRLQQENFPVIDYHVHLKGGLSKEQAHAMSMNYGINYGVAPNLGEGGVGRMLSSDGEACEYYEEVKPLPFLVGAQGEGRRWVVTFSSEAIGMFDYFFTDAMTVVDRGRICRIYRPEEELKDGRSNQQYMDMIVDQTVKILTNEPADIFANATYIPDDMNADYGVYWTDERVNRVLDVLEKYGIALEINARYKIPSFDVIRKAKARGIKFTFGTNNVDADFGRLEYAVQAIRECGLTAEDIWFPSMSRRSGRTAVDYNGFGGKY